MGYGQLPKAQHCPIPCAFRVKSVGESQSLGETLRRQDFILFEARVGRPTVIVRVLSKNGYGDIPPFCGDHHSFFVFREELIRCVQTDKLYIKQRSNIM